MPNKLRRKRDVSSHNNLFSSSAKNISSRFGVGSIGSCNQTIENLTVWVQSLGLRVHELSAQLDNQTSLNEDIAANVCQHTLGDAHLHNRHAMRVSGLEQQAIEDNEQHLWLAEETSPEQPSALFPPLTAPTATATRTTTAQNQTQTRAAIPDDTILPHSNASLEVECAGCAQLEIWVSILRKKLDGTRGDKVRRIRKYRAEIAEMEWQLVALKVTLAAQNANLHRIRALLDSRAGEFQQHAARLQADLTTLRLEKNAENAKRVAAEQREQHLRNEVAEREQQLEYYQQRLLQMTEFQRIKTLFDESGLTKKT
ncbi:MAG: hypothetical protein STHCBS139747_006429 [Sporothrix thermara]